MIIGYILLWITAAGAAISVGSLTFKIGENCKNPIIGAFIFLAGSAFAVLCLLISILSFTEVLRSINGS